LVELFDRDAYNTNMTVAENLLFGTPTDSTFEPDELPDNPYVRKVLHETGLMDDFIEMGRKLAELMVDLFADVEPGSDVFEQFSFIESDDLPEFQNILGRAARGPEGMTDDDRHKLLSLPFKLIVAQHRLDLIDEQMMGRILEARRTFEAGLPDALRDKIAFFDAKSYNATASLQDNILFGKLSYGQAQAETKVGALIAEVVDDLDLRETVMLAGLEFQAGIGGARLSQNQRQKIAIARCLLRQPDLLILNEAAASLDAVSQKTVLENILRAREGKGILWILNRPPDAQYFDKIVVMKSGRVVERFLSAPIRERADLRGWPRRRSRSGRQSRSSRRASGFSR